MEEFLIVLQCLYSKNLENIFNYFFYYFYPFSAFYLFSAIFRKRDFRKKVRLVTNLFPGKEEQNLSTTSVTHFLLFLLALFRSLSTCASHGRFSSGTPACVLYKQYTLSQLSVLLGRKEPVFIFPRK